MATFLAHIKVHEGKEKRFEEIARDLFSATHENEDDVVRYEYWRGSEIKLITRLRLLRIIWDF